MDATCSLAVINLWKSYGKNPSSYAARLAFYDMLGMQGKFMELTSTGAVINGLKLSGLTTGTYPKFTGMCDPKKGRVTLEVWVRGSDKALAPSNIGSTYQSIVCSKTGATVTRTNPGGYWEITLGTTKGFAWISGTLLFRAIQGSVAYSPAIVW